MRTRLVALLLLPAVALLPGPPVRGCAIVAPKGTRTDVAGETALIVWDSQAKVQHFVRAAGFVTGSADFGFLVPTPTKPEVAAADPEFLKPLERLTAPRVETLTRPATLGCAGGGGRRVTAVPAAAPFSRAVGAVTVVEQKQIGNYDVAVLKATDADQLRAWLAKNGYDARPELQNWLGWYVVNGWYVTAFKVASQLTPGGAPAPAGSFATAGFGAVRLSFPTDRPFYPYKEPVDQQAGGLVYYRILRVYLLADARYEPQLGRGPTMPATGVRTVWSGPVSGPLVEQAMTTAGAPATLAGRDWTLTEFEQTTDPSTPRPGIDDLWFVRSPDQSTVERPPTYVYVDEMWPWYAAGAGVIIGGPLLLLLAAWLIRRLVRLLPGAPLD